MRKSKNVSFLDLLPTFNSRYELVRTHELELWFHGDDWGMTDTEKQGLYNDPETTVVDESYKLGTIVQDKSGNITALNIGTLCQDRSVLMQLCAFIADGRDFEGYRTYFDLEMEPEGHLIRVTVVELDCYPGNDDEIVVSRYPVGTLTYDSRLKALVAP